MASNPSIERTSNIRLRLLWAAAHVERLGVKEKNMSASDNAITSEVLRAFQSAWSDSTKDYAARLINSEHTLQAAVYHHLRCTLRHEFSVFTEAVIRLPDGIAEETKKGKVIVDLLVCHQAEIVAAIEIKYTPREIGRAHV